MILWYNTPMVIEQIQRYCKERRIGWSIHAAEMMMKRGISRLDVLNCLENGEIIEDYPNSFPYPSCLVFGFSVSGKIIHTVVGMKEDMLMVITAYFPDNVKFEDDLRTRRCTKN